MKFGKLMEMVREKREDATRPKGKGDDLGRNRTDRSGNTEDVTAPASEQRSSRETRI